mmetsp:Transcript_6360/g.9522  ORF Transcript_6360/g.9522 Transcript_6360/m.9522 type:complete len:128 (-) Transcript_6360:1568-1951(-)
MKMQHKRKKGVQKLKSKKAKLTYKSSTKQKLSRMGKVQKKNMTGPSTNYITRSKALNKLQLSMKDFRRLCILKGIHPRVPTKRLKKSNQVYFHLKDITFMSHEPLIKKISFNEDIFKKSKKKQIERN